MSATDRFTIKRAAKLDLNTPIESVYGYGDDPYIFLCTRPCACGLGRETTSLITPRYGWSKLTMRSVVDCLETKEYQPNCPAHCSLIGIEHVDKTPGYYNAIYGREGERAYKLADWWRTVEIGLLLIGYFGLFWYVASSRLL